MPTPNRSLTVGLAGPDVRRLHAALLEAGADVAHDELVEGFYGRSTRACVLLVQRELDIAATGTVDVDTYAALRLDEACPTRWVVGTVLAPNLGAVPGVTVMAFDRDLRAEQELGTARTGPDGFFQIRYSSDAFIRTEQEWADVFVRVLDRKKVVFDPPAEATVFQAAELVSFTVRLSGWNRFGQTEFEAIEASVAPLLGEVQFAELRQDDEARDVTFLAGETGFSSEQLEHFAVAHRLAEYSGIPAYFFYALLAESALSGMRSWSSLQPRFQVDVSTPTEPLFFDIVLLPRETIIDAVKTAASDAVVPVTSARELERILRLLGEHEPKASSYIREKVPEALVQRLQDILRSPAPDRVRELLKDPAISDLSTLLDRLIEAGDMVEPEREMDARARIAIADLVGNDPALISHIAAQKRIRNAEDTYKLARMNRQDWADALTSAAADLPVGGRPMTKGQAQRHASALVRKMEKAFPTTAFAAQMARDDHPAVAHASRIASLLHENPAFQLDSGNVGELTAKSGARAARDSRPGSLKHSLRVVQRVFSLAPRYAQTRVLLHSGITSAADVVQRGRQRFVTSAVESGEFNVDEAHVAFAHASDSHVASLLLSGQLISGNMGNSLKAMSGGPVDLEAITKEYPNLASLFLQGDMCECKECRSVHSASAYVADVLQWLKNRVVVDTTAAPAVSLKGAKDELFSRRPDLGDMDLSCENTNTPLPYIDLVCELLEEASTPDPGFAYAGPVAAGIAPAGLVTVIVAEGLPATARAAVYGPDLAGCYVVRDQGLVAKLAPDGGGGWTVRQLHQTLGAADEVGAAPEYVNLDAYAALAASSAAFTLPFDLAYREALSYFTTFDVRRASLMKALQVSTGPSDADVAADALGLSAAEHALVVTAAPAGQQAIWTTPTVAASATLTNVDAFVTRSRLDYPDLLGLLKADWVNPNGTMYIRHLDNTCDLAAKEIAHLNDAALDRVHRFVRLRTALGWSTKATDRALRSPAVGKGVLDDAGLVALHRLTEIQARLSLSPDSVCDILTPLTASDDDGAYARVFLNAAAVGTIDPAFTAEALEANELQEAAVAGSGVRLSSAAAYLELALGMTGGDLEVLLDLVGSTAALTTTSLSHSYAYELLTTAMGLSISEVRALTRLTGTSPLDDPNGLIALLDAYNAISRSRLSPTGLVYVLNHEAPDLATRDLAPSVSDDIVLSLDTFYAEAAIANTSPFAADATPEENSTALRLQLSRLASVTPGQLSTAQTLVTDVWTDPLLTQAQFVDNLLGAFVSTANIQTKVAALVAAAANVTDALRNAVIKSILEALSEHFYLTDRKAVLSEVLAAKLKTTDEVAGAILPYAHLRQPAVANPPTLEDILLADATTAAAKTAKERALSLFYLVSYASSELEMTPATTRWVLEHAHELGWCELDALPYEAGLTPMPYARWAKLAEFVSLLAAYPDVEGPTGAPPWSLTGLFEKVLNPTTTAPDLLTALAALTGTDATVLTDLDGHFGSSAVGLSPYLEPSTLTQLLFAAGLLRQLSVDVATGVSASKAQLLSSDTARLRTALKARYSESEWLGVLKQTYDVVRPLKRDALVAYLLAGNPGLTSTNDLFDWFLIDVEMGACMPTSRIVQAHATLQLFVQRCLMGLEPTCVASIGYDDGWKQWQWMANFRVWEANRKIFLYPENWIEPELRDDKSELFVALDNRLQQNELSDLAVEDATAAYLEGLDDIAHLDVMATHYDTTKKMMHVFARTKGGSPSVYYHREFTKERAWSPWATVALDIESDHLLAFSRNDRLTLAWAVFTEQPDNESNPPPIPDPTSLGGGKANDPPRKKWKIQLAVSEFANGSWRPKKVSRGALTTAYTTSLPAANSFNFFSWELGSGQAVSCLGPDGFSGSFALTGCKGYPEPQPVGNLNGNLTPTFRDTELQAARFVEQNKMTGDDLSINTLFGGGSFTPITGKTPGTFEVTYPLQMSLIDWLLFLAQVMATGVGTNSAYVRDYKYQLPLGTLMPFFYGDYDRSYVIVPGFYEQRVRDDVASLGGNRKTFSDILQLVEDAVALLVKYLQKYQEDPAHDLQALIEELQRDPEYIRITEEISVYQKLTYGFRYQNFYHPLVCRMRSALARSGVPGLMQRDLQLTDTGFDFATTYDPSSLVVHPFPREDVDFALDAAYGSYNWELFFHLPFDIAKRLNRDQRFEEARQWYHYVFNPVGATDAPAPQKYWITKPFFQTTASDYLAQRIATIMAGVAADPSGATISELRFAIEQWRDNPFKPHVVARSRPVAFQLALVTSYISNYIDSADSSFRQFTRESVTQATQQYILADKMCGPKPRIVPPVVEPPVMTYNQLEADLDLFGNALVDLENMVPDLGLLPQHGAELPPAPASLGCLYFCIPPNENLLQMWDLIADRLFKIRHCQNIDGVEASLALFSPPIDPGALVRATAAGLDISSFIAGLGAPLPPYRFQVMSARAMDLAQQVSVLGSELLSALEKRDAEAMSRLRADQELAVLDKVRAVKKTTLDEATSSLEALRKTRAITVVKKNYYLDQEYMNAWETAAVVLNGVSLIGEAAVALGYILSGGLRLIPDFMAGGAGFGGSPTVTVTLGGQSIGAAADSAVQVISSLTRVADKSAGMASTQGGYQRRYDEWQFQIAMADKELAQIDQQIATAEIHIDMLNKDLDVHDLQKDNAQRTGEFLHTKYTKQELYEWMSGQLSSVYYSSYKLAFDTAKKAERCFGHELATDQEFVKFGYWNSQKKGLMTAQALMHDLKRMDAAYLDQHVREYELTKHVSFAQLDPQALITLKNTGKAIVEVPETAFDLDHPGHYMRRLKTVSMSIPCVAGPYTTVACTLSLIGNRYRKNTQSKQGAANATDKYKELAGSDPRFVYNIGAIQSIATSTGVSDSGLFELNFHDDRYLPFEGTGAISRWRLEIPKEFAQFDHSTISDVILHLRYTARDGGTDFTGLVQGTTAALSNAMILGAGTQGLYAGVDLRSQDPDAWWQLKEDGITTLTLDERILPYAVKGHSPTIDSVGWYAKVENNPATYTVTVDNVDISLTKKPNLGSLCTGVGGTVTLGTPMALEADASKLESLVILVHYTIT